MSDPKIPGVPVSPPSNGNRTPEEPTRPSRPDGNDGSDGYHHDDEMHGWRNSTQAATVRLHGECMPHAALDYGKQDAPTI
ncbi:hypothetical protein HPB50_024491 [Hyalomma asiaticum]|uniref:Uncharacterized protein n=1 Tax=Hyalomma asiaticum TaxID=266040 RepID=A0ACB7T3U6_HYAAI|nr:hypothetical protein HPB50_024491 [Hyalomma asiaticum]